MATLQALIVLWFGADGRPVPSLLPTGRSAVLGVDVPRDRLLLAALVVVAAVGLWAVYRFTRFGLASRAAADDQVSLACSAGRPTGVGRQLDGGQRAGRAGRHPRRAPHRPRPGDHHAARRARPGRRPGRPAVVVRGDGGRRPGPGHGPVAILLLQDDFSWIPRSGVREALPLVVIVVALALGAGRSLGRGAPVERPLPLATRARRPGRWAAVGVVGGAAGRARPERPGPAGPGQQPDRRPRLPVDRGAHRLVGQISLAQMAFAGVAGFSLSRLAIGVGRALPGRPLLAAAAGRGGRAWSSACPPCACGA